MDKEQYQYQSQVVKLPKIRTNSAKTPIPVVKHIVKDEQDGKDELLQSQAFDIDKVVRLFVDPHCLGLVDRHLHGVRKICKYFPIGFLIKDVVKIIKILNVLSDKAENDTNYVDSICSLLRIFQYPFFKEKASDELFYEPVIVECIANIGYLFRTPNRSVREEICTCIYNLTTFKKIPSSASGELPPPFNSLERCSKAFVLNCVRNSDLSETLAKSLTLMEDDIEMRLKAMKILQLLSDDGRNCERMLNAECASRIVLKMNYSTPNEELLFRSVEIVWNLLENGNKEMLVAQLNSLSAINQLRGAFLKQLFQGFSNYDRQLRNDILIISIELANIRPTLPFIQSGFAKDLLNFATYPEIKSNHPMMKNFKLSTCYEDFELKKLFFNFATAISKNETSYQLLSESGILLSLLSFIKPIEKTRESRDWTISQFEELQLLALSALCLLVPILLPDYITCHGNNRILVFLEWCAKEGDDYVGYGNSFHAKGGRGSRKAQLKYCLRLLRSLMTTNNEQAVQDLTDQGALDSLSSVLTPYCASEAQIEQIDVEIMGDVFFILAIICEKDVHRKELFGNDGVEKLVDLLKKKPQFVWNGLGYQSMIIGCIDCLWATIVGCPLNEDYFIQKEGVFCLLDILEAAPKSIQNLTLGCLLDLSENPKTLTHLLQWEGKDNVKIAHFLCELWRIEERDNKVERDENGFIINTTQPLRSEDSDDIKTSLPAHEPSRAIVEISENMRAKIYGLFCKLGFNDLSGITNQDQMTLCIIENYLDFKLGEVFKEINLELELDEIRPITPDQEALENILRAADDRVVNVTMNQQNMARAFDEQETIQEKEFYYEIKKNFMSKEKKKEDWKEYVERVSKYTTLMDTKQRQLAAIEDSRPAERDPLPFETLHNLEIPNLAVTAFTGPFITIDSTPPEITGGRIGKILNK